jgi:hypothetical protein
LGTASSIETTGSSVKVISVTAGAPREAKEPVLGPVAGLATACVAGTCAR